SGSVINPKELLGKDLGLLTDNIRRLLGSGHPVLNTISSYYFSQQGKHVRPLIVLLMAQATTVCILGIQTCSEPASLATAVAPAVQHGQLPVILPTQRRLAEITEMIHTASLLHDDVIDVSSTRRNQPSANAEFGNKMAILAGDFLLARASVALARLRTPEVIELLATVISNLVEGEFMQLRNSALGKDNGSRGGHVDQPLRFQYYMEKTYMKTASLIALSCRASAVLGGCEPCIADLADSYGRNLGLAFQLVDDMLDFVVTADDLGKPVNADLQLGLATAPVLFAAETYPQLYPLMERNFSRSGDVETARDLVFRSDGLQRTRELAAAYCSDAVAAMTRLPASPARDALVQITQSVLTRRK
ncbi:isoprenoid synthase domain-containing protein, partial [Entophlyctis helioformis]